MLTELRHTLRSLARARGFTGTFIVTLALGIGVATAVFRQAERVLFPRTSMADQQTLVVVEHYNQERNRPELPFQLDVAHWKANSRSFVDLAWMGLRTTLMVVRGEAYPHTVGLVPPNYFSLLGVFPSAGRTFLSGEDEPGNDRAVVLSYAQCRLWFGEPSEAIGRDVIIDEERCTVVGVLGADFRGVHRHNTAQVYRPARLGANPSSRNATLAVSVLGRLRPGVSPEQAQAELATMGHPTVPPASARRWQGRVPSVQPVRLSSNPTSVRTSLVSLAVVGFLYAISLVSALNLMLARTVGRRAELAVRLALGGGRMRIVRLLVVESLVLNLCAGAGGLLVARWLYPVLQVMIEREGARPTGAVLNVQTVLFALGASILAGVLLALLTAWRATRADLRATLQHGSTVVGDSRRLRAARDALIVLQTALAVVLLAGTGLLLKSVHHLQRVHLGFEVEGRYVVATSFVTSGSPGRFEEMQRQAAETLLAIPGVQAIASGPIGYAGMAGSAELPDQPELGEFPVRLAAAADDFRRIVGIRLRVGRDLSAFRRGDPPIFMVNETFARAHFGSPEAAVGRRAKILWGTARHTAQGEIVGVVADTFQGNPRKPIEPMIYYPPHAFDLMFLSGQFLMHLPGRPPPDLTRVVRQALYAANPRFGVHFVEPYETQVRSYLETERRTKALLSMTTGFSLVLTVLGVFAVMSYAVARRRAEFGLRLTLGATPHLLFRLVLERGLKLTLLGVLLGSAAAWALSRFIASLLYETKPYDPTVYGAVALLLAVTATAACWLPARRAMRANPAELLRVG